MKISWQFAGTLRWHRAYTAVIWSPCIWGPKEILVYGKLTNTWEPSDPTTSNDPKAFHNLSGGQSHPSPLALQAPVDRTLDQSCHSCTHPKILIIVENWLKKAACQIIVMHSIFRNKHSNKYKSCDVSS